MINIYLVKPESAQELIAKVKAGEDVTISNIKQLYDFVVLFTKERMDEDSVIFQGKEAMTLELARHHALIKGNDIFR